MTPDRSAAPPASVEVLVIGAGPAGLAAARELRRAGFEVVVLDKATRVGSSWAGHYDRLHLHTTRRLSSLPGMVIPKRHGRWVSRDAFLGYLDDYARHNELDVRLGFAATSVERSADGSWAVDWRSDAGQGTTTSRLLVIATGYNHAARIPEWPGLAEYSGRVMHSSEYRNPELLEGKTALVVGPGNSGAEIAADLAASGVAVQLSIRTPPNIVRRQVLGIPGQVLVLSIAALPVRAQDWIAAGVQRISVGVLEKYGLERAPRGIATQLKRDDVTPTIDVGLLAALRSGKVKVVPEVTGFSADGVRLADGQTITPDVVIAATGFQRGLDSLVGSVGVLAASGRPIVNAAEQSPGHPGLYFIGYSNPLTGNIRQVGIDAGLVARHALRVRP